ncbi:hypothetical protein Acr_24g0013490 [Actinidia rufa]|uniref:F-box domain-containing protein n=1 Tax=Actinidia rufa TaxID=165716 RepID=A0A7J0GWE1_9ERIC|nr:hypothetical protein Acr_24g0013490 [Actinidia rufa]
MQFGLIQDASIGSKHNITSLSSMPEYTSSADKVAANNDLLTEILIRLPARSLMRFKSVSKHWLSLIIDQFFVLCRNPDSSTVSGLYYCTRLGPVLSQNLISSLSSMREIQLMTLDPDHLTTRLFVFRPLGLMCLPFKVCYYRSEIYSTETGSWRASGEPFTIENDNNNMQFHAGVYWNGAINWFNTWGDSLYFDVDERLGTMPMLPVPEGNWYKREFRHYGVSRSHLHLVEIYGPVTCFNFLQDGERLLWVVCEIPRRS